MIQFPPSWDEFWTKVPELAPQCRPMAEAVSVVLERLPEQCYPTRYKPEGELFHLVWDNGKTLLWAFWMECGKWEWFYRDRSNEETHANPDDVLVPGPVELLEAIKPYVERLRS